MNSSIRKKLNELRKENKSSINDVQEKKLYNIIDNHYFRSTLISDKTAEQLIETAKDELNDFLFRCSARIWHL